MNYQIIRLTDKPEIKIQAAQWFHEKWNIPLAAYLESMEECLAQKSPVPQWYSWRLTALCMCGHERKRH